MYVESRLDDGGVVPMLKRYNVVYLNEVHKTKTKLHFSKVSAH